MPERRLAVEEYSGLRNDRVRDHLGCGDGDYCADQAGLRRVQGGARRQLP
jgi:hypothetical protein